MSFGLTLITIELQLELFSVLRCYIHGAVVVRVHGSLAHREEVLAVIIFKLVSQITILLERN